MGTLNAFDPVEDFYEIVYDDEDVEELTWTDLQKLLRASGDTVTAPAAAPPLCSEESMPMSLPVAMQLQKDLMSKVAFDPVKAALCPVVSKESKGDNGKGVRFGYSSGSSSDAHSLSVDGERIVATKTRARKKQVQPEKSSVKTQAPRQLLRHKGPEKALANELYIPDSSESSSSDEDFLAPMRGPPKKKRQVATKKAVVDKSLNVVRSTSLQSYFTRDKVATIPAGAATTTTSTKERDPSRPLCDGRLDECDRETADDISWSTPVSPTHGALKKRKSPAGKGGMDVWVHVGRIREGLHSKYARRNANLQPYTHACYHCGATLALGWSKKTKMAIDCVRDVGRQRLYIGIYEYVECCQGGCAIN